MLLAHDFKTAANEVSGMQATQVVAHLHLLLQELRPAGGIAQQLETIQQQQQRLKTKLWQHIYGSVATELRIAKDAALMCAEENKREIVAQAFASVEAVLRNPFIG